jgi:hypothetical protein
LTHRFQRAASTRDLPPVASSNYKYVHHSDHAITRFAADARQRITAQPAMSDNAFTPCGEPRVPALDGRVIKRR